MAFPPMVSSHFSSGFLLFFAFSLASLAFLVIFFYLNRSKKRPKDEQLQLQQQLEKPSQDSTISLLKPSSLSGASQYQDWAPVASSPPLLPVDQKSGGEAVGEGEHEREEKRRRKRARKKRQDSRGGSDVGEDGGFGAEKERAAMTAAAGKHGVACIYPFSSFSSATQRRIKQQYDQLVKSNEAKALTMAQVCQFANCLIEARNELQHKSEIIQRRFTITKALLFKADRSSFDRLCQQIYKLEAEQKRLEEDAIVYNRLQEQLKLSPAYKTMLEIGAHMESKASSDQDIESMDSEFADISFEELLAQEKKDSFWQRNGKWRSCTS